MEIEIENQKVILCDRSVWFTGLEPGELYCAIRNIGWQLLTCREVNKEQQWVHSQELAYSYDTWECYKVIDMP